MALVSVQCHVMNAYKDDTDCNGVSGVTVRLTDADGKTLDLVTNSAGNFYRQGPTGIGSPYTVKLISGSRERVMATPQTSGNCASCHTATGANGAPGRILAPLSDAHGAPASMPEVVTCRAPHGCSAT